MVLVIHDLPATRRRYFFDLVTPEKSRAAFYLSASDVFVFEITDINGESYQLETPLGSTGVPLGETIFIFCETGSASNYSVMRIFVNGKEMQKRDFGFRIGLGSRQWKETLGTDIHGENGGAFLFAEDMVLTTTVSRNTIEKLAQNIRDYYGQTTGGKNVAR